MTFKVNYGFQKAERDRAKLAKKEAKRREKEEAAKSEGLPPSDTSPMAIPTASDEKESPS